MAAAQSLSESEVDKTDKPSCCIWSDSYDASSVKLEFQQLDFPGNTVQFLCFQIQENVVEAVQLCSFCSTGRRISVHGGASLLHFEYGKHRHIMVGI